MIYSQKKTSAILHLINELNKIESKLNNEKLDFAYRIFNEKVNDDQKKYFVNYLSNQKIHEDIASLRHELYRML